MKGQRHTNTLLQQRITLMLAMLLCLFVSSLEYLPESGCETIENQENPVHEDQNQTFLDVAVDAVVPFVVSVSNIALYFISKIFHLEGRVFNPETFTFLYSNQLVEILFEQIISTKGP